ncbi:MAG: hypothetical protein QXD31_03525, partial [Candidatus Caldarchaeum sp.]
MVLDRLLTIVTDVANTLTSLFSSLIRFALSSPVNAAIVAASIAAIVFVGQFLVRRREKTEEKPVEAESSQEAVEASVIDQYTVDEVIRVKIMKMDGSAKYIVEEPALDERLAGIVANIEQAYVKKGVEPSTILKDLDLKDDELKAVTYPVIKD